MPIHTIKRFLIGVLSAVALVSCAPIAPYRTQIKPCVQIPESGNRRCVDTAFYEVAAATEGLPGAQMAIVEFDDQGYLMRPDLYAQVMGAVERQHGETGALVILFAHGWKHNASSNDGNLIDFEKLLLELAQGDEQICKDKACAGRRTIGVYLGWRGLSATTNPFKQLSFWNRKSRAHRVGQDGATALLADLDVIQDRNRPEVGDVNRLVFVGHSFGGALVYTAVQQRLLADLSRPNHRGTVSRNVADMIILVNPAFEAARYQEMHRRADDHDFPLGHHPVLAVFTSESDQATKKAFPLGRGLGTLFTKYNPDYPDQAEANTTTLGHYEAFFTHRMEPFASGSHAKTRVRLVDKSCGWERFQNGATHTWTTDGVSLNRLERMQVDGQVANPYMVVQVDEEVIPDHNDIFRPAFRDFLYSLVAAQSLRGACGELARIDSR